MPGGRKVIFLFLHLTTKVNLFKLIFSSGLICPPGAPKLVYLTRKTIFIEMYNLLSPKKLLFVKKKVLKKGFAVKINKKSQLFHIKYLISPFEYKGGRPVLELQAWS